MLGIKETNKMTDYSRLPKILLIADYLPEGGAGGGVILRDLLNTYPAEKLFWFAMEGSLRYKPTWRKEIKRSYTGMFCPGRFRHFLYKIEYGIGGRFFHRYLEIRLKQVVQDFKPDIFWFVVQKRTVPFSSRILKHYPKIPVHLSIHDNPLIENRYHSNPINQDKFKKDLDNLINSASSIDSVSQRMLTRFCSSNQKCAVVTRGIEKDKIPDHFGKPKKIGDHLKIVMAGMGQCPPPWPGDIIKAINLLKAKIPQKIEFHAFDFTFPHDGVTFFRNPIRPPSEFDQAMQDFHIGYAPDPMNEYGKEFAASSFSTKLVTYVTHGLPFLYHGPENSTAADFLDQFECGEIIEGHDPEKICRSLMKIITNYEKLHLNCKKASHEHFSIEKIRTRLFENLSDIICFSNKFTSNNRPQP